MEAQVIVVIGAGGIGIAIARRQGFGKHILLADINEKLLAKAAKELGGASYKVSTQKVDVSSRKSVHSLVQAASDLGTVVQVVNTAGVSPNMAPPERVLAVDLYGSAVVFEEFGRVIAPGGAGLIISSMAGHMAAPLSQEDDHALAFTPAEELLALPILSTEGRPELHGRVHRLQAGQPRTGASGEHQVGRTWRPRQFHQPWHHRNPAGAA